MKCDLLTKKDVVATINCQQAVLLPELTRRMLHGWGCRWLVISWLQSTSAVILEPRKIKSDTVSTVSPSISHEVMGPDAIQFSEC